MTGSSNLKINNWQDLDEYDYLSDQGSDWYRLLPCFCCIDLNWDHTAVLMDFDLVPIARRTDGGVVKTVPRHQVIRWEKIGLVNSCHEFRLSGSPAQASWTYNWTQNPNPFVPIFGETPNMKIHWAVATAWGIEDEIYLRCRQLDAGQLTNWRSKKN